MGQCLIPLFSYELALGLLISLSYRGSCAGRVIAGAISDSFGRFNTVIWILIFAVAIVFGLWIPVTESRSSLFYTFAAMFGFSTGSIMSMAPVCIGQYVLIEHSMIEGHYLHN